MSSAEVRVDPWLTGPAVAALSAALVALVPSGPVAIIGAAAALWVPRLGPRAQVLDELTAAAPGEQTGARRFSALAVVAPDVLPESDQGETAFVAALTGLADVVLLATTNPAGATTGNGRWPAYWAARFAEHGWSFSDLVRPVIWDDSQLAPDVKEGALLFAAPLVDLHDGVVRAAFPSGSSAVLHPHRLTETRRAYEARLDTHMQAAQAWQSELERRLQAEIDQLKGDQRQQSVRLEALTARMTVAEHRWGEMASNMVRAPMNRTARVLARRFPRRRGRQDPEPPDPGMVALFDADYYARHNPESAEEPLRHYREVGEANGRRPNPYFDPSFYAAHNPDVTESGMSPFAHYVCFGGYEGRAASEQFDTGWYITNHPDVLESGLHPLLHFLVTGRTRGYVPTRD